MKETRKFSPPFKLVITDDRGGLLFMGEVQRDGEVMASGPFPELRRSHFPANAFLTDRSLRMHSFRISLESAQSLSRRALSASFKSHKGVTQSGD